MFPHRCDESSRKVHQLRKMKQTFTLIVTLLVGFLAHARGGFLNGDCELKYPNGNEVTYMEWVYDLFLKQAVEDTAKPGTEIARFSTKNIEEITGRQSSYVTPTLVSGNLVLTLNENFANFEEEQTEPDITIIVEFKCKDGSARIRMWGTVEDTNNHAPEFRGSQPYIYTLPMPFPPDMPLGCVTGVIVSAIDYDLSTTRIVFEITDTDWLQVTGTWKVGRVFYANITTSRYITTALSATLRATDNGVPTVSSETFLHVMMDSARSMPEYADLSPSRPSDGTTSHVSSTNEGPKKVIHEEE